MRAESQKYSGFILGTIISLLFCLLFMMNCNPLKTIPNADKDELKIVDRSYYPNGNIEYEAQYVNGKLDGVSKVWSRKGELISESEYSNGKPHGNWKTYHSNGNLKYETNYFHGQLHGYEKWYYENTQIKSEQEFQFGKPLSDIIRWDSDGTILY